MSSSPIDIDSLRKQLLPDPPLRLYAMVDAAANQTALDFLYEQDSLSFDCLFAGEVEPDVFEFAPFLVDLDQQPQVLDWLLEGWGGAWFSFVQSELPLEVLQMHLRQFTEIRMPDSQTVWFRFYDPRVMRTTVPVLTGEQCASFFENVKMFVCEGESPQQLLRLSFDGTSPLVSTTRLA
jgi:Domain of unknown function (DUF4123)